MGLIALLTGCAAPAHDTHVNGSISDPASAGPPAAKASAADAWLAAPSADLPQGFPAPGPLGQIILKDYPAYRAAVATASAGSGRSGDALFYPLFNHIKRHEIPMSAPVEMEYAAPEDAARPARAPVSMAFIYTKPDVGRTGPDRDVQVVDVPAQKVVSIAVRGSYTPERFWQAFAQLKAWLNAHHAAYRAAGQPRYLAYNSPFVLPFMRSGEVQIPIAPAGQ